MKNGTIFVITLTKYKTMKKLNEADLAKFSKLKKVIVDGSNNNFTIKE